MASEGTVEEVKRVEQDALEKSKDVKKEDAAKQALKTQKAKKRAKTGCLSKSVV